MSAVNPSPTVVQKATQSLIPIPENALIYRTSDGSLDELIEQVARDGILQPLVVSADNYILSGHRRHAAALACGLDTVPCIVDDVVVVDLSQAERVDLLVRHNRGMRIKSNGELYREAAAGVDPEEAVRQAIARKAQVFAKAKKSKLSEVEITGKSTRTDPSGERREFLAAVLEIIEELRVGGYLPTDARTIHYMLLQKNVRTSSRKNGFIYGHRPAAFRADGTKVPDGSDGLLSKLLTDARSAGQIDDDVLNDGTRVSHTYEPSGTVGGYIDDELGQLFKSYFHDVHAEQPNHVEILVEKNTLITLLVNHVTNKLRVPITSLHGYGSYPAARDVANRYRASGKDKLVVIYVSDLDPEGINMPASWKKYLLEDFGVEATVIRAAVTPEQVQRYSLPPDASVKMTSTRAPAFVAQYGDQCWELDSMPKAELIAEVDRAVRSVLDIEVLNRAFAREHEADIDLARLAAKVRAFVSDHFAAAEL